MTYCSDAAAKHLTNQFWYLDDGDLLLCDPTDADAKNKVSITRWNRINQSNEVQLYVRIHSDICVVPLYVIPGVLMQIKLKKAKPFFHLMNKDAETKTVFKYLDAHYWSTASDLVPHSRRPTTSLSERELSHPAI